jgi:hypothetical protein
MARSLALLLPIVGPLPRDQAQRQLQDEALVELASIGSLQPLDSAFGNASIQIRVVDDPSHEPRMKGSWEAPTQVRSYRLLVLEIDGQECVESIIESTGDSADDRFTAADIVRLSEMEALACFQLEANTLLLLSNIFRPGSLSAAGGYAFVGNKQSRKTTPLFAEHLFSAVEASHDLGWPKLSTPKLQTGWDWLRASGVLIGGMGVGRLGRSLAAVSHLTTADLESTSCIDLVWILLGLESLYSKGNVGLKEQLLGKTEAILGPRTENKKAFGIVYDFRSRLIHGNVDIPLRFTEFNAVETFADFHEELLRNEELALAVLLATLQWMAVNDVTELNFEYSLSGRD